MKRIPRPLNSTSLAREYRNDPTKENKKRLNNLILKAFINNQLYQVDLIKPNLYLKPNKQEKKTKKELQEKKTKDRGIYTNAPNKDQVTYNEVSQASLRYLCLFLGLSEDKARQRLMVLLKKSAEVNMSGEMQDEAMSGIARATIFEAFFRAQQQGLIQSEWGTELRTVARLNGYHPLQVKEANSALATEAQLINQVFNMALKMVPALQKSGTQININQTNQPTTNQQYLTPTMAVALIEEKGYNAIPSQGTVLLDALAAEHGINLLPEVKAIGADAQGVMTPKVQDILYTNHEDRREEELGIVDHNII